jgi:DNA-binding NarL/FixJ family response regulator
MSLSIGVIEDDEAICSYLVEIISASNLCKLAGFARNGEEAKKLIAADQADVYLVDLGLPDADGVDLIALIKATCSAAQSLVISTFGDSKHITRSIKAGASGYLLKEEVGPAIINRIIAVHNGVSPISPSLVRHLFQKMAESTEDNLAASNRRGIEKFGLSPREIQVLSLLIKAVPILNMAEQLSLSSHTVNEYLRSIYKKLNVHSRAMAVHVAVINGFRES